MALVNCPDCGREVSSRAEACPFCGCPINEETLGSVVSEEALAPAIGEETLPAEIVEDDYMPDETDERTGVAQSVVNKIKAVSNYKRVGALEIDELNRRFRIVKVADKSSAGTKILKGTAALYTMGLSLAAEKVYKAARREWYGFDEVISHKTVMDNVREHTSSGYRTKLIKGVSVRNNKSSSKMVTHSASIIVNMNSIDEPTIEIPIITKPLSGSAFDKASAVLRDTQGALDYIINSKQQ